MSSPPAVQGTRLPSLYERESDPVLAKLQPKGLPLLFGDEDLEMGESSLHTQVCDILLYGVEFHLTGAPAYRVFGNLNLYYSDDDPTAYVSPDLMAVKPAQPLPVDLTSYRIGHHGPAPSSVGEVLSFRTYHQGDLTTKPVLYAELGISEYLVVDVTGQMLAQRLLVLRRQPNGRWLDDQDADGGITSHLGFRLIIETDGMVRVLDAKTGKRYARPREAQAAVDRLAQLEAELARQRGTTASEPETKGPSRRRRKK